MLIDWFTVGAQVVNFLVLVAVLRWLLFDRVVAAMDERQAAIAARIAEAEQREADAKAEAESFARRREALDEEAADRMARAEADAEARRHELVDAARTRVDELREGWETALQRDRHQVLEEIRRRTGEQVCVISRRALADLADADLQEQVVRVAVGRLDADHDDLRALLDGVPESTGVSIRSAQPLDEDLAGVVERAVKQHLHGRQGPVRWVVDPTLVCGIEIDVGGWSVGWNVDAYLDAVVDELAELLPDGGGSAVRTGQARP